MKIVIPKNVRKPNLHANGKDYCLTKIYILSRPHHHLKPAANGECIFEHESISGDSTLRVCLLLMTENRFLHKWFDSNNDMDRLIQFSSKNSEISIQWNSFFQTSKAVLYHDNRILLIREPFMIKTNIAHFESLLTGDVFDDTYYDFPSYETPYSVVSLVQDKSHEILQEGFDFVNEVTQTSDLNSGFGTFGNTIKQSAKTFNKAGEDYIFDFNNFNKTPSSSGMSTTVLPKDEIVECIPLYDNTDQVKTFVVPYGSAALDDVTKLFMTSSFQMFYTLLVAFFILFITPPLYQGYFYVAMRESGSSEDIERGNKLTYSTNIYFIFYSILMIVGVIVDATMTGSITEMGFSMMLLIFFVCTYIFTLILRSGYFDPSLFGHTKTKIGILELMNLYLKFMGNNFSGVYSIGLPIIIIGIVIIISIFAYRGKIGDVNAYPFQGMISLFIIGLFMILSTMLTFFKKARDIVKSDTVI
jgi:hypothetical protein